jgi:hypothetical protein
MYLLFSKKTFPEKSSSKKCQKNVFRSRSGSGSESRRIKKLNSDLQHLGASLIQCTYKKSIYKTSNHKTSNNKTSNDKTSTRQNVDTTKRRL